jgi:eukaryotic-like serine/threonine-protein kinase
MRIGAVIVVCAVTSVLVSGGTFFLLRHLVGNEPGEVAGPSMPAITDMTPDEARALLQTRGLVLIVSEKRPAAGKEGKILSQQPAVASPVKKGDMVQVVVGTAPAGVAVPGLPGLSLEDAARSLSSAGLSLGDVTRQAHATVTVGQVVSSNPSADQQIARGAKVALILSSGPVGVAVPRIIGKSPGSARRTITAAGFKVGKVRYRYDEDMVEGRILGQNPAGGSTAPAGSPVDLVINEE